MDMFTYNDEKKPRVFEKHNLGEGELWYMPNFMPSDKTDLYFNNLNETIQWRQEEIQMYGKIHPVPRKSAWYGDHGASYKYSGIKYTPQPWTKELTDIKRVIMFLMPENQFNSVLLNCYKDGHDKVGWHADDEPELGLDPIIASVSLGAIRRFDLKHKNDKSKKFQIELGSGSLLIMKGGLQRFWSHQIPVQKKVKDARINLTFRNIAISSS
jgi:alkylated DNA repair dioxygenase AlkB